VVYEDMKFFIVYGQKNVIPKNMSEQFSDISSHNL